MGRKKKKAPPFVMGEFPEFPALDEQGSCPQGFEPAYVQIGGVRITNRGLNRPRGAAGANNLYRNHHQQPMQAQLAHQKRGFARGSGIEEDGSGGGGVNVDSSNDALDEDLQDYLENVLGGRRSGGPRGSDTARGRCNSRQHGGAAAAPWQPRGRHSGGSVPTVGRDAEESSGAELRLPVRSRRVRVRMRGEDSGASDEEVVAIYPPPDVAKAAGEDVDDDDVNAEEEEEEEEEDNVSSEEGKDEEGKPEADEEEEIDGEEEEDEEGEIEENEEDEEELRGDVAMLRRLLRGFARRDLDEEVGLEEQDGRGNLYEALLASNLGDEEASSSSDDEDDEEELERLPYGRRVGPGTPAMHPRGESSRKELHRSGSTGYYYEYRYDADGREQVVMMECPQGNRAPSLVGVTRTGKAGGPDHHEEQQQQQQRSREGADGGRRDAAAEGATAEEDAAAAEGGSGAAQQLGSGEGRDQRAGTDIAAEHVNRFPFVMQSREQARAASAWSLMAASASGGATPAAARFGWNRQQGVQREQRQRSVVKGALGGALGPGEKKKLKEVKMQAKRAAREAVRGFDVQRVAEQISDFVSGEGDVLALDPMGSYGMVVVQSLAGVYGLKHSVQGAKKRKFLLLQSTDRTKAPDEATRAKVEKIVAAELSRQRRGAAAGGGIGPAGMALQDVTPASVAAARRVGSTSKGMRDVGGSGRGGGGRGSAAATTPAGAATPSQSQGQQGHKRRVGSYSQPVAFVRSGVLRDGRSHLLRDHDEIEHGEAEDAAEDTGAAGDADAKSLVSPNDGRGASSGGHSGSGGPSPAQDWETPGICRNLSRGLGARTDEEEEEEEEEKRQIHQGLGVMDPQREWLAAAFGGLGFRSHADAGDIRRADVAFLGNNSQPVDTARAPGPVPPPIPAPGALLSSGDDEGGGVAASEDAAQRSRLVVQSGGPSYFRTHFCLGPGYDVEERQIQHQHVDEVSGPWRGHYNSGTGGLGFLHPPSHTAKNTETAQEAKAAGKKAAKEARRQLRLQQQKQGLQPLLTDDSSPVYGLGTATAPANLSYEYAAFERHGTGVGSRLMARMGWTQGEGLGRERQGRSEPLRAFVRPRSLGLGAEG